MNGDIDLIDWREMDANVFAMALLMPEKWLRRDVAALLEPRAVKALTDDDLIGLAKRYQIEPHRMALRLVDLKLAGRKR